MLLVPLSTYIRQGRDSGLIFKLKRQKKTIHEVTEQPAGVIPALLGTKVLKVATKVQTLLPLASNG